MDISIAYWQIEDALESREEDAVLKTLEEKFNITIVSQNIARYMDSPETEGCMIDDRLYCIFRQTYSEQAETVKDRTIAYRWDLAKVGPLFTYSMPLAASGGVSFYWVPQGERYVPAQDLWQSDTALEGHTRHGIFGGCSFPGSASAGERQNVLSNMGLRLKRVLHQRKCQ